MNKNKIREICTVSKCNNHVTNSLEKWQMNLCVFHLIEFIKWYYKDKKINVILDKFYLKWYEIKNTNQYKAKKKIWKKIQELELYFDNQWKLAISFEKQKDKNNEILF